MRFHPRHYLLIAVLVALAVWNYMRSHRPHPTATTTIYTGPTTPAWQAFDHAASLRNAPEPQFTPALDTLRTQATAATGPDAADLRNCLMWLQYYRHTTPSASGNAANWGTLATGHVQSCMAEHRDLGR